MNGLKMVLTVAERKEQTHVLLVHSFWCFNVYWQAKPALEEDYTNGALAGTPGSGPLTPGSGALPL